MKLTLETLAVLSPQQQEMIREIWNSEYPDTLYHSSSESFSNYIAQLEFPTHLLLIHTHGEIAGWATLFSREQQHWFAMILSRSIQGMGYGSQLLTHLKQLQNHLYGWVIDSDTYRKPDGSHYSSPVPFYLRNGFIVEPEVRLELPHLSAVRISWNHPDV